MSHVDRGQSGCRLVLVGMMGSGKSTISRLLSAATGWPAYDNDLLLERVYGATARALLETAGETELRAAEEAALRLGLQSAAPCIVDAAAGTILSASAREQLSGEIVVWLRATPETLFARARGAAHRPWLDRGIEWFASSAAERDPLYRSVADLAVDTDAGDPSEVAREIVEWLRKVAACAGSLPSER